MSDKTKKILKYALVSILIFSMAFTMFAVLVSALQSV